VEAETVDSAVVVADTVVAVVASHLAFVPAVATARDSAAAEVVNVGSVAAVAVVVGPNSAVVRSSVLGSRSLAVGRDFVAAMAREGHQTDFLFVASREQETATVKPTDLAAVRSGLAAEIANPTDY
jgi:hypothetical protein